MDDATKIITLTTTVGRLTEALRRCQRLTLNRDDDVSREVHETCIAARRVLAPTVAPSPPEPPATVALYGRTLAACAKFVEHMAGTDGLSEETRHVLRRCAKVLPSTVARAMAEGPTVAGEPTEDGQ